MECAFGDLDKLRDVVEAHSRPKTVEIAGNDSEGWTAPRPPLRLQPAAQALVDQLLERLTRTPSLGLESRRDIVVER